MKNTINISLLLGGLFFSVMLFPAAEIMVSRLDSISEELLLSKPRETAHSPFLNVTKNVSPNRIWASQDKTQPNQTRVELRLQPGGTPGYFPQDIVFVMDNSGSMKSSDPNYYRVKAAQLFVDRMSTPSRAAVVSFADSAVLVNNDHLSSDFERVKNNLAIVEYGSSTNINAGLSLSISELVSFGNPSHLRLALFLTDGKPDPPTNNVTLQTLETARRNNITIHTIGLGPNHDSNLLRWLAAMTCGQYYYASTADELQRIYADIASRYMTDVVGTGMRVADILPSYISYINGTVSNTSVKLIFNPDGTTVLEWYISVLRLNDSWTVSYNITSSRRGYVLISLWPSGVSYTRWDYIDAFVPFPETYIHVIYPLAIPPPPPPPPAMPAAPPPPVEIFPMPAPPVTVVTLVGQPVGAVPVSAAYQALFAPFLGLTLAEALKQKKKQRARAIAVGVAKPKTRKEK